MPIVKRGMKKETMKTLRELATYGSIGMSVAFSIFIGVFAGIFADRFWNTAPWGLFIGFALGLAAAFRRILWLVRKMNGGSSG